MVSCLLKTVVSKTNVNLLIKDIYNQTYQGPPDSFSLDSPSFYQFFWTNCRNQPSGSSASHLKVDNWITNVARHQIDYLTQKYWS